MRATIVHAAPDLGFTEGHVDPRQSVDGRGPSAVQNSFTLLVSGGLICDASISHAICFAMPYNVSRTSEVFFITFSELS